MVIVNFVGHGFQWWQGNNPNPHDFNILPDNEVRMYIRQAVLNDQGAGYQTVDGIYRDGLYGAEDTIPIIQEELNNQFGHLVQAFPPRENCPEHFLINDGGTWNDIYERRVKGQGPFEYIEGGENRGINGFSPLRFREFGRRENNPRRFHPDRQFVCSPLQPNSIFALSWLVNHMREILTVQPIFGVPIHEDEDIILRWLVCRQDLHADDLDDIPRLLNNLFPKADMNFQAVIIR